MAPKEAVECSSHSPASSLLRWPYIML